MDGRGYKAHLAAVSASLVKGSADILDCTSRGPTDSRMCQTFAASPAEPGFPNRLAEIFPGRCRGLNIFLEMLEVLHVCVDNVQAMLQHIGIRPLKWI
ncbi:MAG: hypothetical protein H6Q04_1039 [Acidobacteria bacterium]|nr:hypothetical protein [Acidobacteriota bacterium]